MVGISEAVEVDLREHKPQIPTSEGRERPSAAKLDVHFDRNKLAEMKDPRHGLRSNLLELVDTVLRLPENLSFPQGITLLVGDNGSGKTAIAKAMQYALKEYEYIKVLTAENEDGVRLPWKEKQTHDEIKKVAHNFIYKSGGLISTNDAFAKRSAGLAPEIAQTIAVDADYSTNPGVYSEFPILLAEINEGRSKFWAGERYDRDHLTDADVKVGSHRQTINEVFDRMREERDEHPDRPKIYFLDEPETGLSPRRHQGLREALNEVIIPGSIAVVPTNSTVLFESDLPRIDLDFPERGIHRPSDYPTTSRLTTAPVQTNP